MGYVDVVFDSFAKFYTVHFRHHQIGNDDVRFLLQGYSFAFFSVRSFEYDKVATEFLL